MRSNKKPIPTEPYPRILWYQEKQTPPTEVEIKIITERYYDISLTRLKKLFPNILSDSIELLAREKASALVDSEINLPTKINKIVVASRKEHLIAKRMLESSDNFLQWYAE